MKKICAKDMPVVVIAAPKDPIVQLNISKDVMRILGITEEDRLTYTVEKTWHPPDRKGTLVVFSIKLQQLVWLLIPRLFIQPSN